MEAIKNIIIYLVLFILVIGTIGALLIRTKWYRKRSGGIWYKVHEWDDDYDYHTIYWTRDKPEEFDKWYKGKIIECVESYD
jgi:hypothetical protein